MGCVKGRILTLQSIGLVKLDKEERSMGDAWLSLGRGNRIDLVRGLGASVWGPMHVGVGTEGKDGGKDRCERSL